MQGLVSTGDGKKYKWLDGQPLSFELPWCENEPKDPTKPVIMKNE
jgi:hypothetical protein